MLFQVLYPPPNQINPRVYRFNTDKKIARIGEAKINREFEGDAFAPVFDAAWRETARASYVSTNGLPFSFVTLERKAERS